MSEQGTPTWRDQAVCLGHDPELWWALRGTSEHKDAREICGSCPVRTACIEYALSSRVRGGIWGGFDFETQRSAMRRWLEDNSEHDIVVELGVLCTSCGARFLPGSRKPTVCMACARGLVDAAPLAEFVRALLGAGYSLEDIAADSGLKRETVRSLVHPNKPSRYASTKTRDALMNIQVGA